MINDSLNKEGLMTFSFSSDLLNSVIDDNSSPYLVLAYSSDMSPVALEYSTLKENILFIIKDSEFTVMAKSGELRKFAINLMEAGCKLNEPMAWHPVTWGMLYKWQHTGFKYAYPTQVSTLTTIEVKDVRIDEI
jgi:hypothetical protein